jgi:hypothetical protein
LVEIALGIPELCWNIHTYTHPFLRVYTWIREVTRIECGGENNTLKMEIRTLSRLKFHHEVADSTIISRLEVSWNDNIVVQKKNKHVRNGN